jgi:hypothetical protein
MNWRAFKGTLRVCYFRQALVAGKPESKCHSNYGYSSLLLYCLIYKPGFRAPLQFNALGIRVVITLTRRKIKPLKWKHEHTY